MLIRVAIADDHPMVISGLKNMLQPFGHIIVESVYTSGISLLEGLGKQSLPDVLLLDILFPDSKGQSLAYTISKRHPSVKMLTITSLDAPTHIKAMMRNGCKGYLLKNTDQETLVTAIETVYKGGEFIEPVLKEQMLQNMLRFKEKESGSATQTLPVLTRREKQILQMVVQELSNQEIADRLFISLRTVENHRFNLQQKLDVKNTVGLVKIAIQMGLI
jgi:DNA-binding NarL/FixJ family response regulator